MVVVVLVMHRPGDLVRIVVTAVWALPYNPERRFENVTHVARGCYALVVASVKNRGGHRSSFPFETVLFVLVPGTGIVCALPQWVTPC